LKITVRFNGSVYVPRIIYNLPPQEIFFGDINLDFDGPKVVTHPSIVLVYSREDRYTTDSIVDFLDEQECLPRVSVTKEGKDQIVGIRFNLRLVSFKLLKLVLKPEEVVLAADFLALKKNETLELVLVAKFKTTPTDYQNFKEEAEKKGGLRVDIFEFGLGFMDHLWGSPPLYITHGANVLQGA